MSVIRPPLLRPSESSLSMAMNALAVVAAEMANKSDDLQLRLAFHHIGEMLLGASNGASSPLIEELKDRLTSKGGDVVERTRNEMAGALVVLLMRWGHSQTNACREVAEASGVGVSTLKRIVQGVDRSNVETLPDWPRLNDTIAKAVLHNPHREGEPMDEWRRRLAEWLFTGIAKLRPFAEDQDERRRRLKPLFKKRLT